MNEPLFELVSDENGTVRRPVTPDSGWTPILAALLARWTARRARNAVPAGPTATLRREAARL